MLRGFCSLIKTKNLAQEEHDEKVREGDHCSLVDLLGYHVGNQGEDQGLLDPWTLWILLFAHLDIGNRLN